MPMGVVIRKSPGVTRWAKWSWQGVAVLPGAPDADWKEMRREGEAVEYHAGTLPVTLYRSDTEAYVAELSTNVPSLYVVFRKDEDLDPPLLFHFITASPFEAQDYEDSGEELVERIPMPQSVLSWVLEFVEEHHKEEAFIKRRRDRVDLDRKEDGIGDARIRQTADVYRAPAKLKPGAS